MKNRIFTLFVFAILFAGLTLNAQEYPEKSSLKTYGIHKVVNAGVTVDGVADEALWSTVGYTGIDTVIIGEENITDAADMTVKFKMLWDDANIYLFVHALDDALVEGVNHESDNVELFFNVDSSQHARDGYNNITASQIRLNVLNAENLLTGGGYATAAGDATNFEYVTKVTDDGYDLEAIIPMALFYANDDAIQPTHFDAVGVGTMIEFDIQIGDADDGTLDNPRETILTWNGKNPDAWKDVDVFGYLMLSSEIISGVSDVKLGSDIKVYPTITDDLLRVKVTDPAAVKSISLFNLLGQSVKTLSTVESNNTIHLTDLPRGMYILKVLGNNTAVETHKIIKQ